MHAIVFDIDGTLVNSNDMDSKWDREAALSLGWNFVPVGAALAGIARYARSGA